MVSDPLTLAVNAQIADMAADSLCWLIRRLGPLLATQHIVRPLLDGLHRWVEGSLVLINHSYILPKFPNYNIFY